MLLLSLSSGVMVRSSEKVPYLELADFLACFGFSCKINMLLRITSKQVPTSVNTASQTIGYPAIANASIALLKPTEIMTFSMSFLVVFLASRMASGIFRMSFDKRIALPVSFARAEPDIPIEIPMSAVANAGASFMPSPIMAVSPSFFKFSMITAFSAGRSSACTMSRARFN
ncbi:hypothetical protein V8G54_007850 [Vigna mungo]|uniref:Uncharacterized protein n=1 Tax=Vigna mungo TaxID=3915 RepID=A0AAQ3P664_VIGMU